jgi:hypothetical protein
MIEFKRNKKTGVVEAYEDGKKIGEIKTQGDKVKKQRGDTK